MKGRGRGRGGEEEKKTDSTERQKVRGAFYLSVPNKTKKE